MLLIHQCPPQRPSSFQPVGPMTLPVYYSASWNNLPDCWANIVNHSIHYQATKTAMPSGDAHSNSTPRTALCQSSNSNVAKSHMPCAPCCTKLTSHAACHGHHKQGFPRHTHKSYYVRSVNLSDASIIGTNLHIQVLQACLQHMPQGSLLAN